MTESWKLAFWIQPTESYLTPLLDFLAAMGVSSVGTCTFKDWADDDAVEAVARRLAASGMNVRTYHSAVGLIFDEVGREEQALADCRRQIDVAARWHARTAVFHHQSFRHDNDTYWNSPKDVAQLLQRHGRAECNRRFAAMLAQLAPYGARRAVTVCVENNLLPPFPHEVTQIIELLEQVSSDSLGLCLDSCHAYASGDDVAREIRRAGTWLKETHFSDALGPRGWRGSRWAEGSDLGCRDLHLVVGLGTIDFFDVCTALREIDYPGPIYFEGPRITGTERTLETERQAIELTVRNWRAIEFASLHLPQATEG